MTNASMDQPFLLISAVREGTLWAFRSPSSLDSVGEGSPAHLRGPVPGRGFPTRMDHRAGLRLLIALR